MNYQTLLRPDFSIDCYEGEVVDDQLLRYEIAIAAHGVSFEKMRMSVFDSLVEASILYNEKTKRFWLDPDRCFKFPARMGDADAKMLVLAAFETLNCCRGYEDGFVISIPISLKHWTSERLPLAVADDVERTLLAAVIAHNAPLN